MRTMVLRQGSLASSPAHGGSIYEGRRMNNAHLSRSSQWGSSLSDFAMVTGPVA
jgi:hypothetical protein